MWEGGSSEVREGCSEVWEGGSSEVREGGSEVWEGGSSEVREGGSEVWEVRSTQAAGDPARSHWCCGVCLRYCCPLAWLPFRGG